MEKPRKLQGLRGFICPTAAGEKPAQDRRSQARNTRVIQVIHKNIFLNLSGDYVILEAQKRKQPPTKWLTSEISYKPTCTGQVTR